MANTPTTDAGAAWVSRLGVNERSVTSANASSTPLVLTTPPPSGKRIVLTDLLISVDTDMSITIRTTTGQVSLAKVRVQAGTTVQLTMRGDWNSPLVDSTLEALTSAAGNVDITALYRFSE